MRALRLPLLSLGTALLLLGGCRTEDLEPGAEVDCPSRFGEGLSDEPPIEPPPSGRVALTFDDDFIDTWWEHLGLLDEHGAAATYFVTRWETMTEDELVMLDEIAAAGHEIANHGLTHANPVDYVAENGLPAYIDEQILPALELMAARGFEPCAFAYPWGGRNGDLDGALSEHFEILRDSGRIDQTSRSVYEDGDGVLAHGSRIDNGYFEMSDVTATLEAARDLDGTVVMYAHSILPDGDGSHIRPEQLEAILIEVNRLGLEWITMADVRR